MLIWPSKDKQTAEAEELAALNEDADLPLKMMAGGVLDGPAISVQNVAFAYPGAKELFKVGDPKIKGRINHLLTLPVILKSTLISSILRIHLPAGWARRAPLAGRPICVGPPGPQISEIQGDLEISSKLHTNG